MILKAIQVPESVAKPGQVANQTLKSGFSEVPCGQVSAYPQDEMWENSAFVHRHFFIPNSSCMDTMFMQGVLSALS